MHLRSTLDRARALFPRHTAVTDGSTTLTYAELGVRVDRLAGYLAERGVGPGDRIAALLPNSSACLESYYAAATLAAVLVPLNLRLTPHELQLILRDSEAGWLIADESLRRLAADTLALGSDVREVLLVGVGQKRRRRQRVHPVRRRDRTRLPPAGPQSRPRRRRPALLHQRHHRPAQGRDADAPKRAHPRPRYHRRAGPRRDRCMGPHRADVPSGRCVGDVRDHLGWWAACHAAAVRGGRGAPVSRTASGSR